MAKQRIVSEELAREIMELPLLWREVKPASDGTLASRIVAASRLRKLLPSWYGGEWEVSARNGNVCVRFMGETSSAELAA